MAIGVTLLLGSVQMPESNNTQAASTEAMPSDGPWNWAWDKVAKAAGNAQAWMEQKQQEASSVLPKMPWDMDGAELAQQTMNKRPPVDPTAITQQAAVKPPMEFGGLFQRLINTESGGNHVDSNGQLITSSKGAKGITQVMPATGTDPGFGVTPVQNQSAEEYVRFGRDYLNAMLKHFGNQEQAVAAYNAGPGAIQKAVAKAQQSGGNWKQYIPTETRNYVRKILGS
jgi:hypothetical protein